jgi:hypothetical protein
MAPKRKPRPEPDLDQDRLGKQVARYGTNRKAIMLMVTAGVLGLSGGAVRANAEGLAWALADSHEGTAYTFTGWCLLVAGMAVMFVGVLAFGQFFEIRRKGVRFARRRSVTELRWDQVEDIQVHKTVTIVKGSKHVYWDVCIYGEKDKTIHLKSGFLKLVPSVTELVQLLKQVSGKEVELPPLHDELPRLL